MGGGGGWEQVAGFPRPTRPSFYTPHDESDAGSLSETSGTILVELSLELS